MPSAVLRQPWGIWLVLVCGLVLALSADAQTRFAAVVGEVTDPTGAVIIGAEVTAKNVATSWQRSATTGDDGRYVLENIPPGTYDISASKSGMRTAVVKGQQLFVGTAATINFQLQVGPVAEEVVVTATTALIESTKSDIGQVIQRVEVDDLPVLARTFTSLALLTPTVQVDRIAGGLAIAGQRGFNNNHIVDGVSNRSSGLGDQQARYSQEWIEEFRVNTNAYSAEFGNASGGIINVVTRSGDNAFHGRGFGYFRTDVIDATPAFTTTKAPLSQQRFGGQLGGPIQKEKWFFFSGFEYLNSDTTAIVTSPLEVCAPPATRDVATGSCLVSTGDNQRLFLAKVDWHPNPRHIVNWRYNRQDSSDFNSAVGGIYTVEHGRFSDTTNWGFTGAWTAFLSPTISNELRGVINRAHPFGGTNAGNRFEIRRPSGWLGAPVNHGLIAEDWIQFLDNLSIIRGPHTLKFGLTYSNIRYYGDFRNFRDGQYYFTTDRAFNLADPTTHPLQFLIIEGGNTWDERANLVSLFVQDSWRVHPRVTVNYGLRYDTDSSLAISGATRVHTLTPRLGLAITLDKAEKTVLRISGGLYRDSEHTNLADIFILNNLLVSRFVILNWSAVWAGFFNPFYDPRDPVGSNARLRQYLAEAFAQNRLPDIGSIPARSLPVSANGIESNFTVPETQQLVAGITRQLTPTMSASADFIYSRSRFLLVWRDINITPQGTRSDPGFASKNYASSIGGGKYRALALRYDLRQKKRYAGLSYTLAKCDDNTTGILTGNFATSPFNTEVDRGPCDNDIRHTLVVRGAYSLPLGFELSSIYSFRSEPPYSATLTPLPLFTRYEPRNRRGGDKFSSWDLRVGYQYKIRERVTGRFFWEFYNLLNQRSFTGFVGNTLSSLFGQPTSAEPPRRMQIGFRVDW